MHFFFSFSLSLYLSLSLSLPLSLSFSLSLSLSPSPWRIYGCLSLAHLAEVRREVLEVHDVLFVEFEHVGGVVFVVQLHLRRPAGGTSRTIPSSERKNTCTNQQIPPRLVWRVITSSVPLSRELAPTGHIFPERR